MPLTSLYVLCMSSFVRYQGASIKTYFASNKTKRGPWALTLGDMMVDHKRLVIMYLWCTQEAAANVTYCKKLNFDP